MRKPLFITLVSLLLGFTQPLEAQFNTVGVSRKVAAVQSTGRLQTEHVTVSATGEVMETTGKEKPTTPPLKNINHQVSGVETPSDRPAPSPSKADSTASRPLLSTPLEQLTVSSPYGMREDPFTGKRKFHYGTDYLTASENVYAMMPGRIKKIGYDKKLGNYIVLEHGEFVVTYAHLHTVVGRKGDSVQAGQSIGISGSTGRSTGEHLHVSVRYRKKLVDPDPLIRYIERYTRRTLPGMQHAGL